MPPGALEPLVCDIDGHIYAKAWSKTSDWTSDRASG